MKATIDVRCGDGIWADLRIRNDEPAPAVVHNPGNYLPPHQWAHSLEAYRVAVLRSFHFLQITLRTADGMDVEPRDVATRADHLVELPVTLEPATDLTIRIPLHELYVLDRGVDYSLEVTYGDPGAKISARTQFRCP